MSDRTKTIYWIVIFFTICSFIFGFGLSKVLTGGLVIDVDTAEMQKYDKIDKVACTSDSMGLTIDCEDRLYSQKVAKNHIFKIGSIYIYRENENKSTVHRLVGCIDNDCTQLIFKGDNNRVADPIINRNDVLYEVVMVEYR